MKINFKELITSILIPVVLGGIVGFLTSGSSSYKDMIRPSFAPPGILFPIVWTILYTLMGISIYIINQSNNTFKGDAKFIYYLQLGVNLLWSFFFFTFKWYLASAIWIVLLILLVITMIKRFYNISKLSAYLQIPYLLWLVFALILNISIYILN